MLLEKSQKETYSTHIGTIKSEISMQSTSLGDVLFTKTQKKVLGLLFGKPDETFYLNQIVRLAGVGKGAITRQLERMLASGLLTVERIGNQNHYQANKHCPIYAELLGIVRKSFGVVDVIRAALLALDAQIELAFVYGSIAKGEDTASSDIDLLVVADSLAYADLMAELVDAEQSLGRPINPSIYDKKQVKSRLNAKNAFLTRVMEQPKLWVKGAEDGVEAIR